MGNGSTKMEFKFDGNEPFKPGEAISGEVIVTTTKPLKRISGMEIKFDGSSRKLKKLYQGRYQHPKPQFERVTAFRFSRAIRLSIDGKKKPGLSATLEPGIHRFAFSFELPANAPSTFFSRSRLTRYDIKAILNSHDREVTSICKGLRIVANPADNYVNNDAGRPVTRERSLSFGSVCCTRGTFQMKLQLPKAVFSPGEEIPINGTIVNDSQRPVRIKAEFGCLFGEPKESQGFEEAAVFPSVLKPRQQITWNNEQFFKVPPTTPTEASLSKEIRHCRYLIITMEQIGGWKPKRLLLRLPVRIVAACRSPEDTAEATE